MIFMNFMITVKNITSVIKINTYTIFHGWDFDYDEWWVWLLKFEQPLFSY